MKILASLIALLLTLLTLICLGIVFLVATPTGMQWSINWAERITSGRLHIGAAQGTWVKQFELEQVSYHQADMQFSVQRINMIWQAAALFQRTVNIRQLQITGLHVIIKKTNTAEKPFTLPVWLPRYWHIQQLQWTPLQINQQQIPAGNLAIQAELTPRQITIQQLSGIVLGGQITLSGTSTLTPPWRWQLQGKFLHWQPQMLWPDWPGDLNVQLRSQGHQQQRQWYGEIILQQLNGTLKGHPVQAQGSLSVAGKHFWLKNFQLVSAKNRLNADIQFNDRWQGQWQISIPDMGYLLPDGRGTLISQGTLSGQARVPVLQGKLLANHLVLAPWQLRIQQAQLQATLNANKNFAGQLLIKNLQRRQTQLNQLKLVLLGTPAQHRLNLQLRQTDNNFALDLQGGINDKRIWQGFIQQFSLHSHTLGNWQLPRPAPLQFSAQQAALRNFTLQTIKGYLTLTGQWQKNRGWSLQENGQLTVPALNITLQRLTLSAQADTQTARYQGSAISGNGQLNVKGQTDLRTSERLTHLTVNGNNFLAINTHQYQVWASPDLALNSSGKQWNLTGSLLIPKANITTPNYREQTIELPREVVYTDQQQTASVSNFVLNSSVQLVLGKQININAEGLSGQLAGKLLLRDNPQQLTTGNGTLYIENGKYQAYGQTLTIDYGRLQFINSPVNDPALQIRASKTIKGAIPTTPAAGSSSATNIAAIFPQNAQITVGVDVSGTLTDPQLTLFSTPGNLSQTDILSYLVLGHSAAQASPGDAEVLLQAMSSMNLGGGQVEQLTRGIQNLFGLDQLSVQSTPDLNPDDKNNNQKNTSLVLGKALSPRLYINYSVGLLSPINMLTLRYVLSEHWSIQSSASILASSADLLYSLETD